MMKDLTSIASDKPGMALDQEMMQRISSVIRNRVEDSEAAQEILNVVLTVGLRTEPVPVESRSYT